MLKNKINVTLLILINIILFTLCGCNNITTETSSISLDFSKEQMSIHEIGLIDDVEIFHLDYNKALFGEVDKILRYKDRIYLLDSRQTKSVIVYDSVGQLINVISNYGQGPNNYLQLIDIFIDTVEATLNIVSRMDSKILIYDLNGSQLLKTYKTPKSFWNVVKTQEGYIGYMGNWSQDRMKPYNVWIMTQALNLEKYFFKIDPTWESKGLGGRNVFSCFQSSTYFITPMDYNIYRIENDHVSIAYSFDLGRLSWPIETMDYESYTKLIRDPTQPYICHFYNFQETSNHLIVHVLYRGQYLFGVYNKNSKKIYIANLDHYTGKYFFNFGTIIGFDEKTIYTLVDASNMKNYVNGKNQYVDFESKYPQQIKNLREKFDYVDEDDNPYLVMYHIN